MRLGSEDMLIAVALVTASVTVLILLRNVLFKALHRLASGTTVQFADMVIASLRVPSLMWCIAIGFSIGLAMTDLPDRIVDRLSKVIHVIVIFSVTLALAHLAGRLFRYYMERSEMSLPSTGLAQGVLRGAILMLGSLVILSHVGVSITPILTALGVGGLAVALALQDTLSNFFAGLHILIEKSIRVGDFVKLESGQEGYVEDITWRTARVRMLPNNIVVIPNKKLAESVVVNYHLPEKRMSVLVPFSVSYAADPDRVEEILIEEATAAAGIVDGLLVDPRPFVRFIPGFGESAL